MPRVALFSAWGSTQNVGWVRYAFDQYETPYDLIFKEQIRGGNLRAKYDVIILPDQARSPSKIEARAATCGRAALTWQALGGPSRKSRACSRLSAQRKAPNREQRGNDKATPRNGHGDRMGSDLHRPSFKNPPAMQDRHYREDERRN